MHKLRSFILTESIGKKIILLALIDIFVIICVFSFSGVFNDGVDTSIYVSQINFFAHKADTVPVTDAAAAFRFFKPFYGVVGAWLSHVMTPYAAILVINLSFFFGLTFLAYLFFKKIGFAVLYSTVGAASVAMAYPVFKYGLALGTDISGWFFAIATVVAFLYVLDTDRPLYFMLPAFIGFLGSLAKETGALGLIFCGIYILMQIRVWSNKKVGQWLLCLCVPFFLLQAVFQIILRMSGAPSFLDWYKYNNAGYAEDYYKLHYFIGVEGSAFHIILVFALVGLVYAIKNRDILNRTWLRIYLPLLISTAPVLLWPIFISRVLFIQWMLFVPLALYGLVKLHKKYGHKKIMGVSVVFYLFLVSPLLSLALYMLSGNGSLFTVLFK